jgi:hypothetical protein
MLDKRGFGGVPLPEMGGMILERFQRLSDEIADGSYEQLFSDGVSHG